PSLQIRCSTPLGQTGGLVSRRTVGRHRRTRRMTLENITGGSNRPRGRPFAKGNGGRKAGARNKSTLLAEALLRGEELELVRKAIELAKGGDAQMLKFLLDRILPKDRLVKIDLPDVDSPGTAAEALLAIIRAVAAGGIAPAEGASVANL